MEREGIEHHYVYEWDLGPMSDLATPDSAMTILKAAPDLIFPFRGSGGIELDRVLDLDYVRWHATTTADPGAPSSSRSSGVADA